MRWVPGLHALRHYQAPWLRHDIVAGLVMTTMLVPVGIAYAEASGLPGINEGDRFEFDLEVDRRGKFSAANLVPVQG